MDMVERCFFVATATSFLVLIAATTWYGMLTL